MRRLVKTSLASLTLKHGKNFGIIVSFSCEIFCILISTLIGGLVNMYNLVMLLQKFQTFVLSKMAKGEMPSFLKLNGPVLMNFFKLL